MRSPPLGPAWSRCKNIDDEHYCTRTVLKQVKPEGAIQTTVDSTRRKWRNVLYEYCQNQMTLDTLDAHQFAKTLCLRISDEYSWYLMGFMTK